MELESVWKSQNRLSRMFTNLKKVLSKYSFWELVAFVGYETYLKTLEFISTFVFRCKVFFWRIQIGISPKVSGKIIIYKYPGSKIELGNNFSSISHPSRAMAASIFSPTSLKTLSNTSRIIIGERVGLNGTSITSRSRSIQIGDDVMIAANVSILDSDFHVIFPPEGRLTNPGYEFDQDIKIQKNVWIGTRSIILKGVSIGENSVIAAGSVVTKSIPPNVVAGGVPAKVIRKINSNQKIR